MGCSQELATPLPPPPFSRIWSKRDLKYMLDGERMIPYDAQSINWQIQPAVIFLILIFLFAFKSTTYGLSVWQHGRSNLPSSSPIEIPHHQDEESSLENNTPVQSDRGDYTTTLDSERSNVLRRRGGITQPVEADLTAILSPQPDTKRHNQISTNMIHGTRRIKKKHMSKYAANPEPLSAPGRANLHLNLTQNAHGKKSSLPETTSASHDLLHHQLLFVALSHLSWLSACLLYLGRLLVYKRKACITKKFNLRNDYHSLDKSHVWEIPHPLHTNFCTVN